MVSTSITDSTGHRDPSPREEGVFFLMLLLAAEREAASMAEVGDHETDPVLEESTLNSDPAFYQFTTNVDLDQ